MRRSILCALFVIVFASAALADQVTLKNGDRLTGNIVSGDGKTLLLKTDAGGDVTLKWDSITSIESTQTLTVTTKDGKRAAGTVATSGGQLVVAGGAPIAFADVTAVRNDAEQKAFDLATERMAHPRFNYFWGGIFDTGLALTRGNSDTLSFTLDTKAVRATPRDKLTLYANYVYATAQTPPPPAINAVTTTTANLFQGGLRGDLNISPRAFVFATADFTVNELQHLTLRQVYGGGVGYHVIKNDKTVFDVFAGGDYDRDEFGSYLLANPTPPPATVIVASHTLNSAEIMAGEEFDSHLNKRTMLNERLVFFPNLSHTGDYRIQFNSSLAVQMKTWLSWQTSFQDSYISYPPPGLKGNDLVLSTGLRVLWGAKL
jgi:putative salt-induced outer membrane protein